MGVETRAFPPSSADLNAVANSLADWLAREKGFTTRLNARLEDGALLKMEKNDFGGQFTGLVYTLEVTLRRHGSGVTVSVDDGDLRNQGLALGIGALIFWPLLLTAGYGWMTKGEIRSRVVSFVAQALGAASGPVREYPRGG